MEFASRFSKAVIIGKQDVQKPQIVADPDSPKLAKDTQL